VPGLTMMISARQIMLSVTLSLLASAVTVSAQNAWVLWRRFIQPTILRPTRYGGPSRDQDES
jgi:hypothetical protein